MKPRVLDLYCGLGGWSDGFAAAGFEVLGVEINKEIAELYNHEVIISDVRKLEPEQFKDFEVIVGSPPCRDFSTVTSWAHRWKTPLNVKNGLTMVNSFIDIVNKANPKFWIMENVPRLAKFIDLKPKCKIKMHRGKTRALWGYFPNCLIPIHYNQKPHANISGKYRSWIRAKIPLCISQKLATTIKAAL